MTSATIICVFLVIGIALVLLTVLAENKKLRGLLGGANIGVEQLKETIEQVDEANTQLRFTIKEQTSESKEVRRLEGELEKAENELFEFTDPANWETGNLGSKGTFLVWNGKPLKLDHGPRLSEKQTANLVQALEKTSGRAT